MKFDISVCVITYMHEEFISRTLESINAQKTNCNVEIIIGVDLSTDKTSIIVENFAKTSNFTIKYLIHSERKGMFGNLNEVLELASGKYIALLEGDDYWVDEHKLQYQFDYLEKKINCVACGGNINILKGEEIKPSIHWYSIFSQKYNLTDFIHSNRVPFCTVMFRKSSFDFEKFRSIKTSPHLDWPIYIILLLSNTNSYIKVFSKILSTYRIHAGGAYSGVDVSTRHENVLLTMTAIKTLLKIKNQINYVDYSVNCQRKKYKPTIQELIKHHISVSSITSFYIHNFNKRTLLINLIKNLWLLPKITFLNLNKIIRRYIST
jgi:glycosyltransferase involved in cell wall biosynthesis